MKTKHIIEDYEKLLEHIEKAKVLASVDEQDCPDEYIQYLQDAAKTFLEEAAGYIEEAIAHVKPAHLKGEDK